MNPDQVKGFIENVVNLKETELLSQVQSRLKDGDDPLTIIDDCQQGMLEVGRRYESGTYYISSLIVAGELFREVAEMVHPSIRKKMEGKESGEILLGTVYGDIHDLGKKLFGMMMTCHGFKVHDIGVDVPIEEFEKKAAIIKPDIICLSGLLTTAFDAMRETVIRLKNNPDPMIAGLPIIIGGSLHKSETFKYIGADYWANSAISGVNMCKQVISDRKA